MLAYRVESVHDLGHGDDAIDDACLAVVGALPPTDLLVQNLLPLDLVIYRLQNNGHRRL